MPMNKFWKRKWVEALESGEYKQTAGVLKRVENKRTVGMCCLGVLCDVAGAQWGRDTFGSAGRSATLPFDGMESDSAEALGEELREFFGITNEQEDKLIAMNDDENKSFADIAKHIKKKL